jgi:hypothetical protein
MCWRPSWCLKDLYNVGKGDGDYLEANIIPYVKLNIFYL